MNGLSIDVDVFKKLPQKQQLALLYENTEELKQMITGYKFQQKMQWIAISVLFIIGGISKYLGVL